MGEDQREFGRPAGEECDAGAFELGAEPPVMLQINGVNGGTGNQLIKNRINSIRISGVTPNKKVALVYGFKKGSGVVKNTKCAGTPVDVRPNKVLARLKANGAGNVNKNFFVPSTSENIAYIQPVDIATCTVGERKKHILLAD